MSAADADDKQDAMRRNRRAYLLTGFATGPDTGIGPLWISVLLLVMSRDERCDAASGASGQSCTLEDDWNSTLWDIAGGGACKVDGDFLTPDKYSHDTDLPGCGDALEAYRDRTNYTCNCTGDYSFLDGGVRSTFVISLSTALQAAVALVIAPVVGVYIDIDGHRRKPVFYATIIATFVSMLMMVVLAPNSLWIISVVGAAISYVTGAWMVATVRQSYLQLTSDTDEGRAAVQSKRLGLSYTGNLIFILITLATGFALGDEYRGQQINGILACLVCALWWSGLYLYAAYKFDEVKGQATHASGWASGFVELWTTAKGMRENPEALKFLLTTTLMQNGWGGSFLVLGPTYVSVQLDFTTNDTLVMVAIILICGIPATALFVYLAEKRKIALKKLLLGDIVLFTAITAIIPLAFTEPSFGAKLGVWMLGGLLASFAFAFYYTLLWSVMLTMTPACRVGQYCALHSSMALLGIVVGPLVAGAVGQASNNQQASMLTLPVWNVIALVVVLCTDFERGKQIGLEINSRLSGQADGDLASSQAA